MSIKNVHVNPYIQIRPHKTAAHQQSFNKEKGSFNDQLTEDKRQKRNKDKQSELSPVPCDRQGAGTALALSSPDMKQKILR
mmetsp:Transcript_394/g.358  ORF Transcript_394/g.358 Transcript_394/m.358 type:complete len:81 (-) Transcript_394:2590-2832(-)